jgi:hypothetical protein
MNTTDPSDFASLSIGPGLALGLALLFRRPAQPRETVGKCKTTQARRRNDRIRAKAPDLVR